MKKIIFIVFIAAIVGLLLIVFSSRQKTSLPTQSQKLQTVTLALDWTPNTNHTGVYVALAKGWYKEAEIDLKILPFSSTVSSDVLVGSKKADVGISSTEGVVSDVAAHNSIVSIGAIIQHNTSGLVVRADSGITKPRDLDGKIYGGFGAPFENAIVREVIKHDGGKGEFQNVILDVDAMQALVTKRIDFVWVFEGWDVIRAKKDGLNVLFFPVTTYGIPDYATPNFIAHKEAVKENSDKLKRFIQATKKGYELASNNPKEAADLLIAQNPNGTFPDKEFIYESQQFLSSQYKDNGKDWGIQDKKAWENYVSFMIKNNGVTDEKGEPVTQLDINSMYTNKLLE